MIRVELTNASNGIIKRIVDTQFNGADQPGEITKVYEFDENSFSNQEKIVGFLIDLSRDLAIDLGSDYHYKMNFVFDWGSEYNPSLEEINQKIKDLSSELKEWKEYRKAIQTGINGDI
jgi:hypothetical protein